MTSPGNASGVGNGGVSSAAQWWPRYITIGLLSLCVFFLKGVYEDQRAMQAHATTFELQVKERLAINTEQLRALREEVAQLTLSQRRIR